MNIFKLFAISVTMAVLLTACSDFFISDVNRKNLPDTKPMLVIKSFMCPEDSLLTVAIAKSRPLFSSYNNSWSINPDDVIENATVNILFESKHYLLTYNKKMLMYQLPYKETELRIKPGETYKIEVSAPGFEPVSAFTTVPVSVPKTAGLNSIDTVYSYDQGNEMIRYTFTFNDTPNEVNFYSARLSYTIKNHDGIISSYEFSPKEMQISDKDNDGKLLSFSFLFGKNNWGQDFRKATNVVLTIYSYDEPTWLYNAGLVKLYNSDEGNPFSEPVIVYSNITNGRGIFGSVRKLYVPVKL